MTDEELENYSDKVKGRIKHLSKGYHDERRVKEAALRERNELESYAKQLVAENNKLKGTVDKNQETLLKQAKQTVASEMANAKRQYKEAYEEGDPDALIDAQEALTTAKIRADKVANFKSAPLQKEETPVQIPQQPIETQEVRDFSVARHNRCERSPTLRETDCFTVDHDIGDAASFDSGNKIRITTYLTVCCPRRTAEKIE